MDLQASSTKVEEVSPIVDQVIGSEEDRTMDHPSAASP